MDGLVEHSMRSWDQVNLDMDTTSWLGLPGGGAVVKNSPANTGDPRDSFGFDPCQEDARKKEM